MMKLLPQNKTKSLWSLLIFALAVGGIIYLNFFHANYPLFQPETPEPPVVYKETSTSTLPLFTGKLLPYGADLDLSILESERFKTLKLAPAVKISEDELGKDNPFVR